MGSVFKAHCETLGWIARAIRTKWVPWLLFFFISLPEIHRFAKTIWPSIGTFPVQVSDAWFWWIFAASGAVALYTTFHQMRLMAADPAMVTKTAMRHRREQNLARLTSELSYNPSNGDWGRTTIIDNERDDFPDHSGKNKKQMTGWFNSRIIGFAQERYAEIHIGQVDLVRHDPSGGWMIAKAGENPIHQALRVGLLPLEWIEDIKIINDNSGRYSRLFAHYRGFRGTPFSSIDLYFRHSRGEGQVGYGRHSSYAEALKLSFPLVERLAMRIGLRSMP